MKARFQRVLDPTSAIHGFQEPSAGPAAFTGIMSTLFRASRSARSRSSVRKAALLLTQSMSAARAGEDRGRGTDTRVAHTGKGPLGKHPRTLEIAAMFRSSPGGV